MITIEQQISEVGREIGLRKTVYPSFVARQKMTQAEADEHLARMEQVYLTLNWIKAHADELRKIGNMKP